MRYGTDCKKVLKKFVNVFARFGLPDVLVTDGGPPFNSDHFVEFMSNQGIVVLKSPPYHPASNGQAERTVRTVKEILKKILLEPKMKQLDVEEQINYFLLNYRNSYLTKSGTLPSEHVLSYKPKVLLDLVHPKNHYKCNLAPRPQDSPIKENFGLDRADELEHLSPGDALWYRNYRPKQAERWVEATYVKRLSLNVFQISVNGHVMSAHREQIRLRKNTKLTGFTQINNNHKRRREDSSDDEPDFLGFPDQPKLSQPLLIVDKCISKSTVSGIRRSERLKKKRQ